MTYLEKYVLQKGINKVSDYMIGLGYKSCCVCPDKHKITYHNNPMRNDVTIIFSEKGRAKQVIFEEATT